MKVTIPAWRLFKVEIRPAYRDEIGSNVARAEFWCEESYEILIEPRLGAVDFVTTAPPDGTYELCLTRFGGARQSVRRVLPVTGSKLEDPDPPVEAEVRYNASIRRRDTDGRILDGATRKLPVVVVRGRPSRPPMVARAVGVAMGVCWPTMPEDRSTDQIYYLRLPTKHLLVSEATTPGELKDLLAVGKSWSAPPQDPFEGLSAPDAVDFMVVASNPFASSISSPLSMVYAPPPTVQAIRQVGHCLRMEIKGAVGWLVLANLNAKGPTHEATTSAANATDALRHLLSQEGTAPGLRLLSPGQSQFEERRWLGDFRQPFSLYWLQRVPKLGTDAWVLSPPTMTGGANLATTALAFHWATRVRWFGMRHDVWLWREGDTSAPTQVTVTFEDGSEESFTLQASGGRRRWAKRPIGVLAVLEGQPVEGRIFDGLQATGEDGPDQRHLAMWAAMDWLSTNLSTLEQFVSDVLNREFSAPLNPVVGSMAGSSMVLPLPLGATGSSLRLRPIVRDGRPVIRVVLTKRWWFSRALAEVDCLSEPWLRLDGPLATAIDSSLTTKRIKG